MNNDLLADRILAYLKVNKRLTAMEAVGLFGTTRLGARIYDLRQRGYLIKTVMEDYENPTTGEKVKYGVYIYHGMKEGAIG